MRSNYKLSQMIQKVSNNKIQKMQKIDHKKEFVEWESKAYFIALYVGKINRANKTLPK